MQEFDMSHMSLSCVKTKIEQAAFAYDNFNKQNAKLIK